LKKIIIVDVEETGCGKIHFLNLPSIDIDTVHHQPFSLPPSSRSQLASKLLALDLPHLESHV
jgi:hypothetical protein